MDSPTFRFGSFEINRDEKLLRRSGEPLALPPKAVETLLLLLGSADQVLTKEEIMRAVWPDVSVEDNNLTQQVSLLRRTLGDSWIQTVPKRGYRFVAPVEPEAIGGSNPRLRMALVAAGIVIVLAIAASLVLRATARDRNQLRSVAVLPLQPLSPDDELSALGLGISDAVIQRLTYARGLTVRPLASVRKYLGKTVDPIKTGRELNVDSVLMGTIQRDGDRVRVTFELIDVNKNQTRWSGKLEENARDIFRIQDLVGETTLRSMAADLRSVPLPASAHRPSPETYEAYLKGRYYWSRRTAGDIERSIVEFERATSMDPQYAAAWAGLADAMNAATMHFTRSPNATIPLARTAARNALRIDPGSAEAHGALGFISFYYDRNWQNGEMELQRAIALDPHNATFHQWLGNLYTVTGRFDEGFSQYEKAVQEDPSALMPRAAMGFQRFCSRRYDQSVATLQEVIAMDSSFAVAHSNLGIALFENGKHAAGIGELEKGIQLGDAVTARLSLAAALARSGDHTRARALLAGVMKDHPKEISPVQAAWVYAALGEKDAAIASIERALELGFAGVVFLNVDPRFDPLRDDPRFQRFVERVGLPPLR